MKLKSVQIHGFRSIENMKLSLEGSGHKILSGKNESGKSNILNALNLLSSNTSFEAKDKKELFKELPYVKFYFNFEQDEINKVKQEFYQKFSGGTQGALVGNMSVEQFTEVYTKFIFYQVIVDREKSWKFISLDTSLKINSGWYRLGIDLPSDSPDVAKKFSSGNYVHKEDFSEPGIIKSLNAAGHLSQITLSEIYEDLISIVKKFSIRDDTYVFPVIHWEYSANEHDLPTTVDRNSFSQNPDSCMPLKSMFLLAGIEDNLINKRISEATSAGKNQLQNLLEEVNRKTNQHIKEAWKEYNQVKLRLRSDGNEIVIGIKDSVNTFDYQQRSDGFRRFISFLLLINAEINKKHAHNPLILIDEPETGLHPSSARDLKDRLIELGQDNTVVYATHSISMIDTDNIENNLIVSREGENTKTDIAKEDGISPAENIYQAIGHSIYEDLKKTNILLEGYTDKKIIKLFMIGNDWKDFGICYTGGVTNIKYVISILDLGNRDYFILSDADDIAKRVKTKMGGPEYWYTYEDLDSKTISIEDFYRKEFFLKIVIEVLQENNIHSTQDELFQEDDRVKFINNFLKSKEGGNEEINDERIKKIIDDIKSKCIQKFKKNNINRDKIQTVLNAFLDKIKSTI